jgi:hypothetical protein
VGRKIKEENREERKERERERQNEIFVRIPLFQLVAHIL